MKPRALPDWGWALVLSVGLTAIIYGQTLNDPFFSVDDRAYIEDNPLVADPDWGSIPQILSPERTREARGDYAPILWLGFALQVALFGPGPFSFHAINLLFYALCAFLLHGLLARAMPGRLSLWLTLIFLAHPVHVESVAWVTGRADPVGHALAFGALLLVSRKKNVGALRWAASLFLWIVASLSRAIPGVALAFFFALVLLKKMEPKRAMRKALPFFALSLLGIILVLWASANRTDAMEPVPWMLRPAYAVVLLVRYFSASVAPFNLAFYHPPFPPLAQLLPELFAGVTLLVAALAGMAWAHRRGKSKLVQWALFSFLAFGAVLGPALQLIPFNIMQADRYAFLACIFPWFFALHWLHQKRPRWVPAFSVAVALLFGGLALSRASLWQHSSQVWAESLALTDAPFAWSKYGRALLIEEKPEAALEALTRVVLKRPAYGPGYSDVGRALFMMKKPNEAMDALRTGVQKSGDPAVYRELVERARWLGGDEAATHEACAFAALAKTQGLSCP
jgi:hypothetical protein